MTPEEFAKHVKACNAIDRPDYDSRSNAITTYLAMMVVEEFWHEPIRVMAMGGYYYGADAWMAQHGEG